MSKLEMAESKWNLKMRGAYVLYRIDHFNEIEEIVCVISEKEVADMNIEEMNNNEYGNKYSLERTTFYDYTLKDQEG